MIEELNYDDFIEGSNVSQGKIRHEIVLPKKEGIDTLVRYELKFYNTISPLESMKMMFKNFGKWDIKIQGNYLSNVKRAVWNNIYLLEQKERETLIDISLRRFTIIADGGNDESGYYALLSVVDQNGHDALSPDYTDSEIIIEKLLSKMKRLKSFKRFYDIYRRSY